MVFTEEKDKIIINNILNSVLHAFCYKDNIEYCKRDLLAILDSSSKAIDFNTEVSLNTYEIEILLKAIHNVIKYMDEDEFETILGVTYEEVLDLKGILEK